MTEFKDVKKILIIKLRHIGDVVLTTPAITAVRQSFPDAFISVLVNKGTEDVLIGNPALNSILLFERDIVGLPIYKRLYKEIKFIQKLRDMNFDMIINLTGNDRAAVISLISNARYKIAYKSNKGMWFKNRVYTHMAHKSPNRHIVLANLDLLRQFNISYKHTALSLFIDDSDVSYIQDIVGAHPNIVHIHPVSKFLHKCWNDKYMAEVAEYLISKGFKVVITSSDNEVEIDKARNIMSFIKGRFIDLTGKTTLKQLAALSKISRFFIGIDSGAMHIAAAVGTPVVAFFGPSSETLWSPWCEKKLIIAKDLPCRLPCKNKNNCKTYECINSITPHEAISKIGDFMRSIN